MCLCVDDDENKIKMWNKIYEQTPVAPKIFGRYNVIEYKREENKQQQFYWL